MRNLNIAYFIFAFIGIFLVACSIKIYPSSEVKFERKQGRDIFIVTSWGYGKSPEKAMKDAERRAFEVILFQGIPNSSYSNPFIDNKDETRDKNKKYFSQFFEEEGYRIFINFSNPSSNLEKDRQSGLKKKSATIGINIHSLRKDLEKNGIIKKFGY